MDYNCEKNVVSNLWKERGMAGAEVPQRANVWCYFKGRAATRIFSLFKWFFPSSVKRLIWFKFKCFSPSEEMSRGAERLQLLDKPCCSFHFPSGQEWKKDTDSSGFSSHTEARPPLQTLLTTTLCCICGKVQEEFLLCISTVII